MNSAIMLLERTAAKFGGRIAIEDSSETITYEKLRELGARIGSFLLEAEIHGPVMVYLPKSIGAIASFMGAMYSGNVYVPTDPLAPPERLKRIIDTLKPACVITDRERSGESFGVPVVVYEDAILHSEDCEALKRSVNGVKDSDPIYVIFTSGSTGTPKGVTIPHRGVIDYSKWVVSEFGFSQDTVLASQAPLYFDNSVFDIYGAIRSGAKLCIIPDSLLRFPSKLPEFLREKGITDFLWVPTVMINVANSGALEGVSLPKLRTVAFAGEVMPNAQLNIWRKALPDCRYANLYGPTEITDVCCFYDVKKQFADHDPLPIGKARKNMSAYILDEDMHPVKCGDTGELCIAGSALALGYWNQPELTNRAFVQMGYERIYRTGDLCHMSEDGELIYEGRMDGQIKVKGNRIELGEVENAARCIEGVLNCCALFDSVNKEIVLFVESGGTLPFRRFNLALKQFIPGYMLPSRMEVYEKLPLTPNGKIDRVKLKNTLGGTK